MRRPLVTGVTGLAGSHLVDYVLTRKECEVVGIPRWRSHIENFEHFADRITLLESDLRDAASARDTLAKCEPGEIYDICGGTAWRSVQSMVDHLLSLTHVEIEVKQDPARPRPSDVPIR